MAVKSFLKIIKQILNFCVFDNKISMRQKFLKLIFGLKTPKILKLFLKIIVKLF